MMVATYRSSEVFERAAEWLSTLEFHSKEPKSHRGPHASATRAVITPSKSFCTRPSRLSNAGQGLVGPYPYTIHNARY